MSMEEYFISEGLMTRAPKGEVVTEALVDKAVFETDEAELARRKRVTQGQILLEQKKIRQVYGSKKL